MKLFERYEEDTLFEIDEMRSMNSIFIGKLITGMAFAYSMILMPWFLRFIFAFFSVSLLVPLGKDYFFKQLKGLRLTHHFLELRRGRRGRRIQRIHFKDVRRIELIEKQPSRGTRYRSESRRTLFEQEKHIFHPEAKCIITLSSGNTVEIEASYFEEGDFEDFLNVFERTYANTNQLQPGGGGKKQQLKKRFQIREEGQLPPPAQQSTSPASPTDRRYQSLIDKNQAYLEEDFSLKARLESEIREAYCSIYQQADGLDISRMENPEIIYEFKDKDNSSIYILRENYLEGLDTETIATGENLIEAYRKNLRLVEMRIAYYKKIKKRLQGFMFQEKTRHKLNLLSRSLQDMQQQNTERSTDHPSLVDEDDIDIENRILSQLEDLSDEVRNLKDLEKAIMLNEHISLFRN